MISSVENHLTVDPVDPDASIGDEVGAAMTSAAEGLSDAWLTARVAASLRFELNQANRHSAGGCFAPGGG